MQGVDAIAEVLRREGVEFLSVYPAQPLIDACAKVGVRPVICRQERVGMAISDGFSRTTNGNRLGVFASQVGSGYRELVPRRSPRRSPTTSRSSTWPAAT